MASKSFGGSIKLTGESEYQKALRGITDNLKVLNSEMRMVSSQYDTNDNSAEKLNATTEVLNKKIAEQENKVKVLRSALEDAKQETGENSDTTKKWQVQLNNAEAELNNLNKSLKEQTAIFDYVQPRDERYAEQIKEISDQMRVLDSEMKVVTSRYDKNDSSAEKLSSTTEILNKKISAQEEKVKVLRNALRESEEFTGKNSDATRQWQIKLNEAEAELNDLNKELKDQHGNLDKSSDKALKLGDIIKANLISEGIIAGIKGLGKAIGALGSAFIDVGKQAVQSYAQQEQLIGGVETLFKDSANSVIENANNAFKTSGMNANQYMETVTSFSASLISSLDGDTAKATEIANMAIVDMSDNANKMGTSIESIQNAYQGFAKGNYTMLDNLKLGYGGSATEMARLINESGVLGDAMIDLSDKQNIGTALQEVGYAKMIEAIHKVQSEMGLSGTTALEASKTITGSTGSMKSAWENLVTGIADDNADFETLVGNLVESIVGKDGEGGFINNMLPRIQTALDGIVTMVVSLTDTLLPKAMEIGVGLITNLTSSISANLPALLESANIIINTLIGGIVQILPQLLPTAMAMLETLINGIVTALPQLIPMVMQIILTLTTSIIEMLPQILQAGITILIELVKGISQALPELIPTMIRVVMDMVNILLDNIDVIIECGIVLLVALTDGIMNALPELISRLPEIIIKIVSTLIQLSPQLASASLQIMTSLALGLIRYIPEMVSRIPQVIKSAVNALEQGVSDFADIGKNLVKGLWNGISDTTDWLVKKIKGMGKSITKAIKEVLGIHSPSRVFKDEVGKNLALGIGEGFGDTMADVTKDMQGAIPTEFDTDAELKNAYSGGSNYDYMVRAFKEALKDVKVVMNNREMGEFVTKTIEKAVYT